MIWPLVAAGAIGAGAALLGNILGGETKKEASVYHAPYETYAPQTTSARTYNIQYPSYQVQMNSPLASQSTKKEMRTEIDQEPSQSVAPVGGSVPSEGTNWVMIAGLGVAGLVAYGLVSGRKK